MASLRHRTVSGAAWIALIVGSSKFLRLFAKFFLARLLTPNIFGIAAVALVVIHGVDMLRSMGIKDALITQEGQIQKAADTALWIHLILGTFLYAVVFALSPLIAAHFGDPVLQPVIRVLGLIIIIQSFETVPSSLLEKELRFKRKLLPGIAPDVLFVIVAIVLATRGYGVWSIIGAELAAAGASALAMWIVATYRPTGSFGPGLARDMLTFGHHVNVAQFSGFFYQRFDDFVVGSVLGTASLGFYSIGYTISNFPTTYINKLTVRALFPAYAKQDQEEKVATWQFSLDVLSLLTVPAGIGIFVIAPTMIPVLIGTKWLEAVPVIRLLAIYGISRSIVSGAGNVLKTTGNVKIFGRLMIVQAVVLAAIIFPLSSRWGLIGAGAAVIISALPNHAGQFWYATKSLGISVTTSLVPVLKHSVMSVVMGFFVHATQMTLQGTTVSTLVLTILTGVTVYGFLVLVFDRQLMKQSLTLMSDTWSS